MPIKVVAFVTAAPAIEQHRGSCHYKAFGMGARDLAAGRPVVSVTDAVDVAS